MQNSCVANTAVACKMAAPANATLNLIINYRAGNGVYIPEKEHGKEQEKGDLGFLGHIWATFTAVYCIKANWKWPHVQWGAKHSDTLRDKYQRESGKEYT
ncbi:hypothetical protein ACLKA6_007821 [Drosophila palustris]